MYLILLFDDLENSTGIVPGVCRYLFHGDEGNTLRVAVEPGEDAYSQKTDAYSQKTGAGSKKTDARSKKIDARSKKTDTRSKKTEARSQKTDTRSKKTDAYSQKTYALSKKTDVHSKGTAKNQTLLSTPPTAKDDDVAFELTCSIYDNCELSELSAVVERYEVPTDGKLVTGTAPKTREFRQNYFQQLAQTGIFQRDAERKKRVFKESQALLGTAIETGERPKRAKKE